MKCKTESNKSSGRKATYSNLGKLLLYTLMTVIVSDFSPYRLTSLARSEFCIIVIYLLSPLEACGITVQGNDKWRTLIQNASKQSIR